MHDFSWPSFKQCFKRSVFLSGLSEPGKGGNQCLLSMGALLISFNSNENSTRPLSQAHNPLSKTLESDDFRKVI